MNKCGLIKIFALISAVYFAFNPIRTVVHGADGTTASVIAECSFVNGKAIAVGAAVSTGASLESAGAVLDCRGETDENNMIDIQPAKGNIGIIVNESKMSSVGRWDYLDVTVRYLDSGAGWFFLRYTTEDGNKTSEYVSLTDTGEVLSYTFSVMGVSGGNGVMYGNVNKGYDVEICTTRCIWQETLDPSVAAWSPDAVTVKSVSIVRSGKNANIKAEARTERVGNIFYDYDVPEFKMTYMNRADTAISFTAVYKVYMYDKDMDKGEAVSSVTVNYSIRGGETLTDTICAPVDKYGLYLFEAELTSDSGLFVVIAAEFSKCVKSDALNKTVGAAGHIMDKNKGDPDKVLDLMKDAGLGISREGIRWQQWLEDSDGTGSVDNAKQLSERHKNILNGMKQRGIEPLLLIAGLKSNAAEDRGFPGADKISEYNEFVEGLLTDETVKDTVDCIEIGNEPDLQTKVAGELITSATPERQRIQAEEYVRVLTNSYEIAKAVEGKNYKVGAFTVCMLTSTARSFMDYALSALTEYKGRTGNQAFDYLILHPYYSRDNDPEPGNAGSDSGWQPNKMGAKRYIIDYYRHLITGEPYFNSLDGSTETISGKETGNVYSLNYPDDREVWISETGISSAYNENSTMCALGQYNQAKFIIRDVNQAKLNNFNNKIYIYDMVDDGDVKTEEQHNYGLVRSETSNVPYAAKYSYLAVANYNRMTAESVSAEEVYNTDYDYIVKYEGSEQSGRDVYMLWTPKTNGAQIDYSFPAGKKVYYYDMLGNRLSESEVKSGGKYILSDEPYYAVSGSDFGAEEFEEKCFKLYAAGGMCEGTVSTGAAIQNPVSLTLSAKGLDADESVYVVYAEYESSELKNIKIIPMAGSDSNIEYLEIEPGADVDKDSASVFIWENLTNQIPCDKVIKFNIVR